MAAVRDISAERPGQEHTPSLTPKPIFKFRDIGTSQLKEGATYRIAGCGQGGGDQGTGAEREPQPRYRPALPGHGDYEGSVTFHSRSISGYSAVSSCVGLCVSRVRKKSVVRFGSTSQKITRGAGAGASVTNTLSLGEECSLLGTQEVKEHREVHVTHPPSLLKAGETGFPNGQGQQVVAWPFPSQKQVCVTQQLTGSISRLEHAVSHSQPLVHDNRRNQTLFTRARGGRIWSPTQHERGLVLFPGCTHNSLPNLGQRSAATELVHVPQHELPDKHIPRDTIFLDMCRRNTQERIDTRIQQDAQHGGVYGSETFLASRALDLA
ncbi:hypothetical protein BJV78DRAFT_1155450 [Lactifluus subvellereus]|nr:hypothetical protein BJV78DRAFT_1155450 [Lactifluus subvellereus]